MLASKSKYDVVIIGAGLSGSAAAAEAGLQHLKTLVVGKRQNRRWNWQLR